MDFGKSIQEFSFLPNICYLNLVFFNNMYKRLVILFVMRENSFQIIFGIDFKWLNKTDVL